MSNLDYIYYAYSLDNEKPKNKILLIYCYIRKIMVGVSPSMILLYSIERSKKRRVNNYYGK